MALITEKKKSISGGVNQQAPEHRLSSQVEEMINCVPTLDRGLVKRNPTDALPLTFPNFPDKPTNMVFEDNMWTYEYDRGSGALEVSEFSFSVTTQGLQVVNVNTGEVYNEDNGGIFYKGGAKQYLLPFAGRIGYSATTIKDTVFLVNKMANPRMLNGRESHNYKRQGYLWIKRIDPIDGYTYGATINVMQSSGVTKTIKVPQGEPFLTSQEAATDLANRIAGKDSALSSTTSDGSLVQVKIAHTYTEILSVNADDSFGDTASFGWGHKVDVLSDLPKNMAGYSPLCRIGSNSKSSYWMEYVGGLWEESYAKGIKYQVDPNTMPHILTRRYNASGTYWYWEMAIYEWNDRKIGDDDTNELPEFLDDSIIPTIKDIFFFRNRMGLMSSGGTTLSEVGEYGNFWRTSTAALLDSDRIDVGIESRTAINLEYAVLMEDSVIFWSDKSQFKFEGGDILSPSAHKVTEITAYEIDNRIRPLLMNDRIFFVSRRGNYSAIMQMFISNQSTRSSKANDITAHVQQYIHGTLDRLTGSAINNMLFISSYENREIVFVYKYYENGNTLEQSAWFKWQFKGQIYGAFTLGQKFHLMIDREDARQETQWIMGDGRWNMNEEWDMDGEWLMSPESLASVNQFESMDIVPQHQGLVFLDNRRVRIESFVNFGEWVAGADGNKEIRGNLQFKTIQFSAEDYSEFDLWIRDKRRVEERRVSFEHIKGRKPMVYGLSTNMQTGIITDSERGFRINTVSFEGNLTRRAKAR